MQVKVLLSATFITLSTFSALAQNNRSTVAAKKSAGADTVTKSSKNTGKPNLLASNTPNNLEKITYSHVPLAGEKSYFGDKDEYVTNFVRKYMETNNQTLNCVQNNSAAPFSVIDNILQQKKMPKELKYLAVIESALNHNAVSHAGAVGPWQMMETTARMMGLSVSRKKDERTDWEKSTNAATKYLDLLYSQLNDWLLVIAAYNSGPTPVQKAIEKTGSHNFWEIKEYLPKETQGHVLAFIATATIFENLSKFISLGSVPLDFNFTKEKDDESILAALPPMKESLPVTAGKLAATPGSPAVIPAPVGQPVRRVQFTDDELKNMSIVKIDQPISFDLIAQELGVDKKILTRWNPDYDQFIGHTYATPFYKLRFPKDKIDLFLQKKDALVKKMKSM